MLGGCRGKRNGSHNDANNNADNHTYGDTAAVHEVPVALASTAPGRYFLQSGAAIQHNGRMPAASESLGGTDQPAGRMLDCGRRPIRVNN